MSITYRGSLFFHLMTNFDKYFLIRLGFFYKANKRFYVFVIIKCDNKYWYFGHLLKYIKGFYRLLIVEIYIFENGSKRSRRIYPWVNEAKFTTQKIIVDRQFYYVWNWIEIELLCGNLTNM
jgi:hypothetical protein